MLHILDVLYSIESHELPELMYALTSNDKTFHSMIRPLRIGFHVLAQILVKLIYKYQWHLYFRQ